MTESKNLPIDYVACRFLNEWRGFAFYKTRQTNQIKQKQVNLVIDFIKILLVLIFVLLVLRLVKPISLTVKLKISAFFAYAIILPLLVISSIASQYIRQSEAELAGKLQKNSQRIIESIDAEFYWYKRNLEKQLKKQLEGFFNSRQAFSLSRNKAKALLQQINTICKPSEIMLIDETKKDHLAGISPRLTLNSALLRTTGGNTAKMLTMSDYKGWLDFRNAGLPTAKGAYSIQDRFSYLGVGELEMSAFIKVIVHAGENMRKAFFTLILWKESELNEQFIDYYIKKYLITNTQWQLAIYNRESEELFVSPFNENKSLLRLINRSIGRPLTVEPLLEVNNKSYMAVARPGKNLNKLVFSVLYPTAIIKQLTKAIWYKALLLAFFLCLLASATIYLLRSWIFVPLEQLKTGINAFANRQFNQQLEVVCSNELGNLISAFNNSLENLKELEVARIVQESILPNNVLKKGRVHVVAQTSTMTKLGGDYYDIVELDEERCLLLMGDATGHGIPAALSMAMAKAVLLHEQTGQLDQKRFMQQIHFLFKNLRKQGSKDLMTILCVELNYHTGKASLLNLGHCFPLLLKKNAAAAELLETISGLPPGFGNERKFVQVKLQLEPGDSLTLYTDGFVECCNEHSEPLGFRGLAKALAEARDEDPATHLKNLENKIAPWEKQSKDDKTIMIIKFL
jgi:serine phosphatase RsbU (regulator of sigma subunit)